MSSSIVDCTVCVLTDKTMVDVVVRCFGVQYMVKKVITCNIPASRIGVEELLTVLLKDDNNKTI